jgi:type I restriction enzyme R subunit
LLVKELGEEGFDQETVKELTHLLVDIIKANVVVEWTEKADAQREMRRKIKSQLRVAKYRGNIEALAQQLVELAKVHFRK